MRLIGKNLTVSGTKLTTVHIHSAMPKVFIKKFLTSPLSIGAIAPSSKYLASKMCKIIDKLENYPVLEVGAGTGAITKAIIQKNPKLIEIDSELSNLLKIKYPFLTVINNCCLEEMYKEASPFGLVVSIPLINNPIKPRFIKTLADLYTRGFIKWCVIYTYGNSNPLKDVRFKATHKHPIVFRNIPPARVWSYE